MSDGDQRHFGFYPSSGGIRITRFDGPSVYQWNVLKELKHETLDFDDWNELRVRIEPEKFQCYLNNHLVYEAKYDPKKYSPQGKFGLVKFRHTSAKFRRFEYGTEISSTSIDPKKKSKILALIDNLPERANVNDNDIETLSESADIVSKILKEKIELLEKQSKDLTRLRSEIRTKATVLRFRHELDQPDESIDLLALTLLLAQLDNPDLSIEPYLDQVDGMVEDIKSSFDEKIKDQQKLEKLISYLFQENGFHGSRSEYYHKANSYMSRVLEDREGLPVTLSVLFMALGERLGLNIEGIGLPGHFIVRYQPTKGTPQLIDVFEQGQFLSRKEAEEVVAAHSNVQLTDEYLEAVTKKAILERMLMNLIGVTQQKKDIEALLPYYEVLITIDPQSSQYRGMYSLLLHESGRTAAAITQLELLEKNNGDEVGEARIQQMREFFNQAN
ncbi:MAG: hypothetical protein COA78_28760 [Blastopirellula sp.]|nr:MAG: hypothetical protein COA78_28760 [Blastopirellula sp.]